MLPNICRTLSFVCLSVLIGSHSCGPVQEGPGRNTCSVTPEVCNDRMVYCSYNCHNNSAVMDTVEPLSGTVKAIFRLPPIHCCHTHYTVNLLVSEHVKDESSCFENTTFNATTDTHSTREYYIKTCENASCSEDVCKEHAEVVFKYVFSGCYKLKIYVKMNENTLSPLQSCPQYIRTNYTKSVLTELPPILDARYHHNEQQLQASIFFNFTFEKMQVDLLMSGSLRQSVTLPSYDSVGRGSVDSPAVCVTRTLNGLYQNVSTQEISCTFNSVSTEGYCIWFSIYDDRCAANTIWTKNGTCHWSKCHTGNTSDDKSNGTHSIPMAKGTVLLLVVIAVVILIHAVCGIWIIIRRNRGLATPVEPENIPLRGWHKSTNLLLLYPRDCYDFMKTMSSFRRLLTRFDNVQVSDCHSDEEDLNDPVQWLQKVMHYPNLCIIVVTSPCGIIQQQAMLSGSNIANYEIYKQPTYLDSVFIYGLKQIMCDISPDVYTKIRIIGFRGFSSDDEILYLPTKLTVYKLPEHLSRLLSDMGLEYNQGDIHDTAEYLSLQNSIKNLRNYKSINPHYLDGILNLIKCKNTESASEVTTN